MTFTDKEQKKHRAAFVEECRQKAWGAACNADWIGKQCDELLSQYETAKKEDTNLEQQIKELDNAPDYHAKDHREKRRGLQERRNSLFKFMEGIGQNVSGLQNAMQQLYAKAEQNLALVKHAEVWEWKEV